MQTVMMVLTIALLAAAALLFLAWLVSFNLLMVIIRLRHPRYYKKIGRPYTRFGTLGIAQRDDSRRARAGTAWWYCLKEVYKGVPRSFLKDSTCESLAGVSRLALRRFVPSSLILLFIILPVDGFVLVLSKQPGTTIDGIIASTAQQGGKLHVAVGKNETQTPQSSTQTTNDVTTTTQSTNQPVISTPVAPTLVRADPGTPPTESADEPITRADLAATFASIAPAGQQKPRKRDICQQLITDYPIENDLGPNGAICTDGNLSTYTTY